MHSIFLHEGDVRTMPPCMPANRVENPMKNKPPRSGSLSYRLMSYQHLTLTTFIPSMSSVRPQYTEVRLIPNPSDCGSCLKNGMAKPRETVMPSRNRGERSMTRLVVSHGRNRWQIVARVEIETTPQVWPLPGPKNV